MSKFCLTVGALTLPLLAMMGGCASNPPVVVQPIEVKVPVAVPCKIVPPTRPAFEVDALPLDAGIWDQMKALMAERLQRMGYESELEAAVKACQ